MLRELERALTNCKANAARHRGDRRDGGRRYGYAYGYEYVRDEQQARPKEGRPAADESELWS